MIPIRLFMFIGLAGMAVEADALTRTWPGPAPCDSTLQACINAAAAADRVEVASNGVIDETLIVNLPMTLTNAIGYRPQLAVDRLISANIAAPGSWNLNLEGFTLRRGLVTVSKAGSGNGSITIKRMRVLAPNAAGNAQISVYRASGAGGTLGYLISDNRLNYSWSTFDGALKAAIQVLDREAALSNGRIEHNHVTAGGSQSLGILVSTIDATHTALVYGNTVLGGSSYGSIHLRQGHLASPGAGALNAIVVNNLVMPAPAEASRPQGISFEAHDGSLFIQAFNNTVVGAQTGIEVYVGTGLAGNGRIANNLLAGNGSQLQISHGGSGSIDNDHNLLHGYVSPSIVLGAGSLTGDPNLRGQYGNPRLRAGSIAINAADSTALRFLLTNWNLPALDADGLRRFKGPGATPSADIGAIEYGDTGLLHLANAGNTSGHITTIDHPASNNQSAALLFGTANFAAGSVANNNPFGAYYTANRWRWYHEQTSVPVAAGEAYNTFFAHAGEGAFNHQATAASTSGWTTRIDHAALNNQSDRIVLVSRNWNAGAFTYNPHPLGVFYFGFGGPAYWHIANIDTAASGDMPVGIGFNVYAQAPSANAFRVTAGTGNISGSGLLLDHPLLNGNACAQVQVTRLFDGSAITGNFDVYYTTGRWAIFGYGGMPAGTQFHVLVDPAQVFECSDVIFANGYQP